MKKYQLSARLILALLLLPVALLVISPTQAQLSKNIYDSTYRHRNNIKLNLSSWTLYNNVFVVSYERSVTKHQTFAVTGGVLEFPSFSLLDLSNINFKSSASRSGFTIGGEYRFYLAKENKYAAPHGLYVGPYMNYFHFNTTRNLDFTDSNGNVSSASLGSKISIFNLGVQVGYQFVLWDRMTIDLILLAPSISSYSADFTFDGNINTDHQIQISQELVDALKNHFPLLNKLISDRSVHVSGNVHNNVSSWAPGLRFTIFLGYRFGK
jgi:hypothetical protein